MDKFPTFAYDSLDIGKMKGEDYPDSEDEI
jgi:hypothetical protein